MTGFSKALMVSTDVAHIVLFHPDDLAHASDWPIAWYSEPFVYPLESAAGRLIAWSTRSDGSFALRLTDGAMTEREQSYAGPSWTFPYSVRHGRVFLDNTDTLPGKEQMTQTTDAEEYWIDIANGDYAVTVTALEWSAEPSAREDGTADKGSSDNGADKLPDYVVQFQPASGEPIKPARRPPDLVCLMEAVATDKMYAHNPKPPEPIDFSRPYPAFASANVTRPGGHFSSQGEAPIEAAVPADGDKFAIFDTPFVVAAELVPGAPAVIAECHGSSGSPGKAMRFSFRARQAVQIAEVAGMFANGRFEKSGTIGFFRRQLRPVPPEALAAVRIAPLPEVTGKVEVSALRARMVGDLRGAGALGRQLGGLSEYEARKLEASDDAAMLMDWLIDHLPLHARERLRIATLAPDARYAALSAACDGLG
jgi:hypothetical protein